MWVLLDNYDSFTHILHHYLLQCGKACQVFRNDEISIEELKALQPERLIISPGPETPLQSGVCMDAVAYFYDKIPILGICLGHQALGMFFGAQLIHAPYPMHGKVSEIIHDRHAIFKGIPTKFSAMRYHSLALQVEADGPLQKIAVAKDDHTIMAISHKLYPCIGLQFHPESIGTPQGITILKNWLSLYS
jgi:anthranilate synthase/aminodeoxychorismate synthase-like glutamine amidotransferase